MSKLYEFESVHGLSGEFTFPEYDAGNIKVTKTDGKVWYISPEDILALADYIRARRAYTEAVSTLCGRHVGGYKLREGK